VALIREGEVALEAKEMSSSFYDAPRKLDDCSWGKNRGPEGDRNGDRMR